MTGDTCGDTSGDTTNIGNSYKQYITKNNYYKYEIKETNIKPDILYTKSPPKCVYSKLIELPCILESNLVSILYVIDVILHYY